MRNPAIAIILLAQALAFPACDDDGAAGTDADTDTVCSPPRTNGSASTSVSHSTWDECYMSIR